MPNTKHTGNIYRNGELVTSYPATPGVMLSPSTIPWPVLREVGQKVFGDNAPLATSCRDNVTVHEVAPDVFEKRVTLTLHQQVQRPDGVWTTSGTPEATLQWVGVNDWSGAK